jgi:hypothetical protein
LIIAASIGDWLRWLRPKSTRLALCVRTAYEKS